MLKLKELHSYRNNVGIGFLIVSFGLSNVNAALATQIVDASPVIVQPNDLSDLSQQMLEQDRINRDQELAIRGLIDDNQRLADTALARQQDATLEQINQTLTKYRDALLERDQMRIVANSQRVSKYHDLITLTEDVDNMKDTSQALQLKSAVIGEKHETLTELKNEMLALNEKLKSEAAHENFVKTSPQQEDKIKMLTQRLVEMDQKIAHFDEILAAKDQQIAQLKNTIEHQDLDMKTKDESIRWLSQMIAVAKSKAQYYQLTSQQDKITMQQVQKEVQQIKDDFVQRFKNDDQFEKAIVSFKSQVSLLGGQLSQKQQQVDLLKSELEDKITELKSEDRLKLARQLIDVQRQQIALLEEKNRLRVALNALIDKHAVDLEHKMEELSNELYQKEQQVELLKTELENKITELKNQRVLGVQIQDLKARLQDKENQIAVMKSTIQADQETQAQADTLKQQLADQQGKVDLLKQELDSKNAQYNQMTLMMSDYQKKLESKDNAYNEELGQVLSSKNNQAQMEGQIADLSAQVQDKEAQIVKIKKDLYDLQELSKNKDMDIQAKDLNLSTMQQKMTDEKIKEYLGKINSLQTANGMQALEIKGLRTDLALARQQLSGMPSSDEINFLRTGLKKATVQLKQKDEMLLQIKANADEYAKKFKEQSLEFKSLKEQLQNALDEINRKNEDLKYKKLELIRFKERSTSLLPSKNDPLREKLKQALDKIDEQGRIINVLSQKLQDAGQSVNLTRQ